MYDENVTYKVGFNWVGLIVKIVLLILFILFLVWLFPKNDLTVFYDKIYSENIQTMKDAARNYYTTDRLPANVGDSTKMTLKQMFDNKMLIKFKDKDNNYCDETASYVEVTKSGENEYVLKVQLNCGDQKDYILETIGCNDVCPQGKCDESIAVDTTPETPSDDENYDEDDTNEDLFTTTTTYYKHRKAIVTSTTEFICPEGYSLNDNKCIKQTIGATIEATKHYKEDQTITTDAKVNTGDEYIEYAEVIKTKVRTDYTCPAGYTLNGSYCIKYTDPIENKGKIYYVCPEGYSLDGQTCTKTYDATYTEGKTNYTCPEGYSLDGTKCVAKANPTTSVDYTCPAGYTENGTKCYIVTNAESKTDYTCPAGYTRNGSKCTKTETIDATPNTTYGPWNFIDTKYYTVANKAYTGATSKLDYDGMVTGAICGEPCGNKGIWYKYSYYTRTTNTTYTCPAGYTRNGSKCTKTETINADADTKLYCPSGYKLEGNKCTKTIDAEAKTNYTCPTGYKLVGVLCEKVIDATPVKENGTYICPEGGTLYGTKCSITVRATQKQEESTYVCPYGSESVGNKCKITIDADAKDVYSYTCPTGFTASGSGEQTICSRTRKTNDTYYCEDADAKLVDNKCVKTIKGEFSHYSCPTDEYTLDGDKCTKKSVEIIDATSSVKNNTTYKYTWSTKSKLDGWEFTGETKTETSTYTAFQK